MATSINNRVLIACALKREAQQLRRGLAHEVPVVWTGLGGRRTQRRIAHWLQEHQAAELWFTGTCGALAPNLECGEVVLPTHWLVPDGQTVSNSAALMRSVPLDLCTRVDSGLTVSTPVLRSGTRRALFEQTRASVCDMESFFAIQAAAEAGVQVMAFKVVSDTAESGVADFWRNFDACVARVSDVCNRIMDTRTTLCS